MEAFQKRFGAFRKRCGAFRERFGSVSDAFRSVSECFGSVSERFGSVSEAFQIQVFTVGGNLAKTINTRIESSGYRANGIVWDGKDDFGDELARGVYVYKVKITTPEGLSTEKFQKLVLLK